MPLAVASSTAVRLKSPASIVSLLESGHSYVWRAPRARAGTGSGSGWSYRPGVLVWVSSVGTSSSARTREAASGGGSDVPWPTHTRPSVLSYRSAVEVVASGHERGTTVQAPSRTTHGADHVDRRRAPDPGAVGAAAQEQPGAGVALPDRAGLRRGLVERGGRRAPGCACRHGRQVAPPVRRPPAGGPGRPGRWPVPPA